MNEGSVTPDSRAARAEAEVERLGDVLFAALCEAEQAKHDVKDLHSAASIERGTVFEMVNDMVAERAELESRAAAAEAENERLNEVLDKRVKWSNAARDALGGPVTDIGNRAAEVVSRVAWAEAENAKLADALAFYADTETWTMHNYVPDPAGASYDPPAIEADRGERARAALAGDG